MAHKSADSGREWETLSPAIAPATDSMETVSDRGSGPKPPEWAVKGSRRPAGPVSGRGGKKRKGGRWRALLPGVRAALIALSVPVVTLTVAIRLVATSGFLWLAYHRPGFPRDSYGLSTDDRMTYGSYGVNYIVNVAPESYLSGLRTASGQPLFLASEVQHMTDVKRLLLTTGVLALVVLVLAVFSARGMRRRAPGLLRSSFFAGGLGTLGIILVLGVLAVVGWDSFFTGFHRLFFPGGNWEFNPSDTLIRLYPPQFWVDAAAAVAVLTLLATVVVLAFSWPTRKRRIAADSALTTREDLRRRLDSAL